MHPASPTRVLRIGLVGCGRMGLQHLRVISLVPHARVVGLADSAYVDDAARAYLPDDAIVADSVESLLSKTRPDVVHIVTPPHTHAAFAIQALKAGCHVYVEKPFAETLDDTRAVLALAKERGLQVCAGHQYLFERPAMEAVTRLPEIGRLVHVESVFSFRMVRRGVTAAEQCKDILPHAVYPLLQQLHAGRIGDGGPVEIIGINASASGDLYALLRVDNCIGILTVTLSGRPVEQYQHLIGTHGSLRADFITGSVVRLVGPGAGLGVLFTPYRRAFQTLGGATRNIARLLFRRTTSYPGLHRLIAEFYESVRSAGPPPCPPESILETVDVCEKLGRALDTAVGQAEDRAHEQLLKLENRLPVLRAGGTVLVTGGTGFLGRPLAMELRSAGFRTRVLARHVPPPSRRVPGVEYVACDAAAGLTAAALDGVHLIVNCVAETAGGKNAHERNSVAAASRVMEAAARTGIRRVIHVSSLAVLKPGYEVGSPLDEQTPIDSDNLRRGPYVWGKAESESQVKRFAVDNGIELRIVRPGPLVDYKDFTPPGRLGREVGPWFIAMGSRKAPLSVCDVWTAARLIRSYVEDFAAAPPLVNLVEDPPPTRSELVSRLLESRKDLRVRWIPDFVLMLVNGPAKLAQRLLLGSKNPIDIRAAFASERYRTDLAAAVIAKAGPSAILD